MWTRRAGPGNLTGALTRFARTTAGVPDGGGEASPSPVYGARLLSGFGDHTPSRVQIPPPPPTRAPSFGPQRFDETPGPGLPGREFCVAPAARVECDGTRERLTQEVSMRRTARAPDDLGLPTVEGQESVPRDGSGAPAILDVRIPPPAEPAQKRRQEGSCLAGAPDERPLLERHGPDERQLVHGATPPSRFVHEARPTTDAPRDRDNIQPTIPIGPLICHNRLQLQVVSGVFAAGGSPPLRGCPPMLSLDTSRR